jgi:hypothetical protein
LRRKTASKHPTGDFLGATSSVGTVTMTWLASVFSASERWIRRDDIYRFDASRWEAKIFVTVCPNLARLLDYNTLQTLREHN